ncbi:23 kDa integral membrane protein-like [Drosophila rhopaloa]|uniref:Tetraspanin n=1 Tax=Drosophila rhopaloa TaxID=1041015 RepID=A0A6P4EKF1_DRORH|nr:23 kDa integral membrane protein-like [Drosophila rhopaloa]
MSCATSTVKYSFFFFNAIWLIFGILVIVFGASNFGEFENWFAICVLVVGVYIFLTSLFGCCGAVRESPRMLWMYVTFLLALLVVQVTVTILTSKDAVKKAVENHWKLEETHPGSMDSIQTSYQCCGLDGAADYLNSEVWNHTVPNSCCKNNSCVNPQNLNREGCLKKVELSFEDENSDVLMWGLFGLNGVIIVLDAILAIHYTNSLKKNSQKSCHRNNP